MSRDNLNDYLKEEYKNIAEAHFRTNEGIASFFRYYLLIMSAPIAVLAAFVGLRGDFAALTSVVANYRVVILAVSGAIAVVGFCVMLYVVNLRHDAVLYARTVNAIRKHFYDKLGESLGSDIGPRLWARVLPQSRWEPKYFEGRYFVPVILAFAIFNTLYLVLALSMGFLSTSTGDGMAVFTVNIPGLWWLVPGTFCIAHLVSYSYYSWYREHSYLRSFALGVDIDGVLNIHRQKFCEMLQNNVNKTVDPDAITTIPLHDCRALGVSRDDEKQVFNDPRYWTEMPAIDGAASSLESIRNLKLKIHVFTHRPWPNPTGLDREPRRAMSRSWADGYLCIVKRTYLKESPTRKTQEISNQGDSLKECPARKAPLKGPSWLRLTRYLGFWTRVAWARIGKHPIEGITKRWLRLNGFSYDSLTVERGSEDIADPQGHTRNRFYLARKKKIRFFVEDDLDKAIKLAYICDLVFLLKHPYNQNSLEECCACEWDCKKVKRAVPANVRPVSSWDEIYREIRRLS